MSILKSLADMALNAGGQKGGLASMVLQNPKLMNAAMGLLSKDSAVGGVQGLLAQFQTAGMGDKMQSWLGSGENDPIESDDVQKVLGNDVVEKLAADANMAPADASQVLAMALPAMIDKMSPKGSAENMDLGALQGLLGGFLKGKL